MSYLDVITLAEAKNHLRVDDDFIEDDASIEMMIKSALTYIERLTNHLVYSRDKTYARAEFEQRINVYDYPINDDLSDINALYFSYRYEFTGDEITLNVGYDLPKDVPSDIKMSALSIIENWYYNHEKQGNTSVIPSSVDTILSNYKRFLVI